VWIVPGIPRDCGEDGESRGIAEEQSVAVGCRARDRSCGNDAAASRDVFDDHALSQRRLQSLSCDAGDDIGGPSGATGHHKLDDSLRVGVGVILAAGDWAHRASQDDAA